jgi:hypothetical protein
MRHLVVLAAVACVALLVAGCGAKSEKERFVDDASRLCDALAPEFDHGLRPADLAGTGIPRSELGGIVLAMTRFRDETRSLSTGLAAIKPPNEVAARRLVDGSAALAAAALPAKVTAKRFLAAAQRHERAALESAFTSLGAQAKRLHAMAIALDRGLRAYGVRPCNIAEAPGLT